MAKNQVIHSEKDTELSDLTGIKLDTPPSVTEAANTDTEDAVIDAAAEEIIAKYLRAFKELAK